MTRQGMLVTSMALKGSLSAFCIVVRFPEMR